MILISDRREFRYNYKIVVLSKLTIQFAFYESLHKYLQACATYSIN